MLNKNDVWTLYLTTNQVEELLMKMKTKEQQKNNSICSNHVVETFTNRDKNITLQIAIYNNKFNAI